jgi:hypothetical protein
MRRLVAVVAAVVVLAVPQARAMPHAKPSQFRCLLDGVKPAGRDFYVFHRNKKQLARAVQMSESGMLPKRGYPVGTILQVLPLEAMIKRPRRFNPDGDGWEFVRLAVAADGSTQVVADGKVEVANAFGSCQGCHARVAPAGDLVCGLVIGAGGLGLTEAQLAAIQASDPRCR